jgi:riboflavin transporter FmnP
MTASQEVHLLRCASSFVIAAYFDVRLIPQVSRALHLDLLAVPSILTTFCGVVNV